MVSIAGQVGNLSDATDWRTAQNSWSHYPGPGLVLGDKEFQGRLCSKAITIRVTAN